MRISVKRWIARCLVVGAVAFCAGAGGLWLVASQLVAPVPRVIGPPPADSGAVEVAFPSGSGSEIRGWLAESEDAGGAILLLHGIRADRRDMSGRAAFLRDMGFHTLAIDFQAHGESAGGRITLGHLEAMDATAAVAYLRERYEGLPVAVIGTSLGGAAALMADYAEPPEAMVVEAVFADVPTGIRNRLEIRFGRPGRVLSPLLVAMVRPLVGIAPGRLDMVEAAAGVTVPVLVIHGKEDRHARPAEAERIHGALGGPTEIWSIPGAAHVDLHHFAGNEYEKRVGEFIRRHAGGTDD